MTLTVGILGLGSIGLRHAGNLLAADVRVNGYDPGPERRSKLADMGGDPVDTRTEAMDGIDAVVIASPSADHLRDIAEAIEAGRHVFVEKPLAHSAADVKPVLDRAEASGLTVFAALNLRFHRCVREAKGLLDGGAIGETLWGRFLAASYLPDWRPGQDYRQGYAADPATGGVLFDYIHEFDLAVHLMGPAETAAATARHSGRLELASEDCADAILLHENGVQTSIHVDYITRPNQRHCEIAGTEGIIRMDLEANRLVLVDADGTIAEDQTHDVDRNAMYIDEMTAFLDCLANGSPPPCSGRDALAVLELVIRARELSGLPTP